MHLLNKHLKTTFRQQKTLQREVSFSGLGVHTGKKVLMRFLPAEENHGIFFRRIDLPGAPLIPASLASVCDTARSTTIGTPEAIVHTVEHVVAALHAYQIDNLVIEVSSLEPPIADGGSIQFVQMVEEAGIQEQQAKAPIVQVQHPLYWSQGEIHLVVLPHEGYRVSYTLNYPQPAILQAQFFSTMITPEQFKAEIAPSRTFSLYEEISFLIDRGLIKGGSLDNAVVVHGDVVFSREGLRYPNEMVRHKILDLVGDLSLIGIHFEGHVIALRSGHGSNFELAKKMYDYFTSTGSH